MIARVCYYYPAHTMDAVLDLTFPQFFMLIDQLPALLKTDPRGRSILG